MIFSKTSEYAIRALSTMADRGGEKSVGVREVSEASGVPAAYVAKIFQGLSRAGILDSVRGANGGYVFRKDPSALTLYEIVKVTEDLSGSPLSGCVMGLKKCSDDNPCALHPIWAQSRDRMVETLKSTSIGKAASSMRKAFSQKRQGRLSKHIRPILKPISTN